MRCVKVPFVDLKAEYRSIGVEVRSAMADVLRNSDFVLGKALCEFENDFAEYCDVRYAVGVASGTSALELALRAYEIGPGDEVITAANTYIATAFAISYTGATPVLVDVDTETYTIDVALIERAITDRTRAIIPVHLYGHAADMDPILDLARRHELIVIEDACQAHGAKYKGRPVGSLGHAAAFSFYPAKNLGAYGDGGMVVTNNANIAAVLRQLRNYGSTEKYHHVRLGYNHRLDTLQAAILRVKLHHLDTRNAARRRHAERYRALLADTDIVLPHVARNVEHVYHLFVIRTRDRDGLRAHLASHGIETGIHYPIPIHLQPAYRDLGYENGSFPNTEKCARQILSLPMYAELTQDAIQYVAEVIRDFVL